MPRERMDLDVVGPAAARPRRTPGPQAVRLLEVEPDFGAGVDEAQLEHARRLAVLRVVAVDAGEWAPADLRTPGTTIGPFAGLVLCGLLARECRVADRWTSQLIGPGDVIGLEPSREVAPQLRCVNRAAVATRIAVLDERFLGPAQRWPWLTARLTERTVRWADRALVTQAINQIARVDRRILALLWHLADEWGRVERDGVIVPLRLTHAMLGSLIGAQRPTVSLALKQLRELDAVRRCGDGWLLSADSRGLLSGEDEPASGEAALPSGPLGGSRGIVRAGAALEMVTVARSRAVIIRGEAVRQRERAQAMRTV